MMVSSSKRVARFEFTDFHITKRLLLKSVQTTRRSMSNKEGEAKPGSGAELDVLASKRNFFITINVMYNGFPCTHLIAF